MEYQVIEVVYDFSELVDLVTTQNEIIQNIYVSHQVLIVGMFFILAFLVGKTLVGSWFNGV